MICKTPAEVGTQYTVCPACNQRLRLDDPPADNPDLATPTYTVVLAEQIREAIGEHVALPPPEQLQHIITEAFFMVASAIRRGHRVDVEYLGAFAMRPAGGHPLISYVASEYLLADSTLEPGINHAIQEEPA
jgi:hypothetical protein